MLSKYWCIHRNKGMYAHRRKKHNRKWISPNRRGNLWFIFTSIRWCQFSMISLSAMSITVDIDSIIFHRQILTNFNKHLFSQRERANNCTQISDSIIFDSTVYFIWKVQYHCAMLQQYFKLETSTQRQILKNNISFDFYYDWFW